MNYFKDNKNLFIRYFSYIVSVKPNFEGDSADRETIREIMALERGIYGGIYIDHLKMVAVGINEKFKN